MAQAALEAVVLMTVEEFLVCRTGEGKAELVRGELRVSPPAGAPHGVAGANVLRYLTLHVFSQNLGRVFGDGFGYELVQIPQTVRVPDGSFIRHVRFPPDGVGRGLIKFAPDIAIEVLSPSETASDLQEKIDDYLSSGTTLLWVLDPVRRSVMVVSPKAPLFQLHEGQTLEGGDVLPGFSCAVSDLFDGIARDLR